MVRFVPCPKAEDENGINDKKTRNAPKSSRTFNVSVQFAFLRVNSRLIPLLTEIRIQHLPRDGRRIHASSLPEVNDNGDFRLIRGRVAHEEPMRPGRSGVRG